MAPPMPGMIAQNVPMAAQRSTSHMWRNTSRMPSLTPPSFPVRPPEMLDPETARSMISGIAKNPMVIGTRPMPSQRNVWPKVKR